MWRPGGGAAYRHSKLLSLGEPVGTQPQGDMSRLHSLLNHSHDIVAQCIQVRLVSQFGRESFERLRGIVLPSVEAAVYKRLDAPPQRHEQRGYHEGGGDDDELRLLLLAGERAEYRLDSRHAPEVD